MKNSDLQWRSCVGGCFIVSPKIRICVAQKVLQCEKVREIRYKIY